MMDVEKRRYVELPRGDVWGRFKGVNPPLEFHGCPLAKELGFPCRWREDADFEEDVWAGDCPYKETCVARETVLRFKNNG